MAVGCSSPASTVYGYTSGPPVRVVGWDGAPQGPATGPLASSNAGGSANGAIGCRYARSDVYPHPIATCVPLPPASAAPAP